jgi:tyrosine-protein kinase Etk/Wzc
MLDQTVQENGVEKKSNTISPRELVLQYIRYVPWVLLSVLVMMLAAYIKLRYSTPVYSVSGKLLVKKNNSPYSGSNEKFDDIFMMQSGGNNLNDEMEVIKSRSMAARVVKALQLQTQYFNKGNIRTSQLHPAEMPFTVDWQLIKDSTSAISNLITVVNNQQFKLNVSNTLYNFNQVIDQGHCKFRLIRTPRNFTVFGSNQFLVNWAPLESVAAGLSNAIGVLRVGELNSNVVSIAYNTENIPLGNSIINQFMIEYQKFGLEDKKSIASSTLSFIDGQLAAVKQDLGGIEKNLQTFQETSKIFNPEKQSDVFFDQQSEAGKQLLDNGVKLKVVQYLSNYIADKTSPYRTVSSSLGIEDPSFAAQVNEFNKLQYERESALKTTAPGNPMIKNMEEGIEILRNKMLGSLSNVSNGLKIALVDINSKSYEANSEIKKLPSKQKQLLEVTRQQKILEELYSYLLQKRLETSISSASTISNVKILETPLVGGLSPISPNRKGLYTMFIFIGLLIPVGIIFLLEYLNDKVKTRADIEKLTSTPVLGEVGHAAEGGALVVTKNNRQFIAEQFRIIRSNLQYILPKVDKPVMMVTSSFSGEGKSFISTNLGAVLAISGKKTVILEFDIRKPKIMEGLGLKERKGITNFIVGSVGLSEIIFPVPGQDNLFVIPCGPVPPNPAEMLLDQKIVIFFEQLKKQFDVIIIDTAPVGLVSDAITLAEHANACMYIVRHNYTYKKQVNLIDELYVNNKLPHLSIIINDIISKGGYGNYGYGNYGYGYGNYGYGYGGSSGGYFEGSTSKKKSSFFSRVRKKFLS